VGEVPFCRANVGHRLHDAVFWFETGAQRISKISELMKTSKQAFRTRWAQVQMRSLGRDRFGFGLR
jgi:hypothetical protein